jgi:hypothetical protein
MLAVESGLQRLDTGGHSVPISLDGRGTPAVAPQPLELRAQLS